MTSAAVAYEGVGRIAVIRINRPEKMNRLDTEIVHAMQDAWRRFMATHEHWVAVLVGGEHAFSAGADLKAVPHDLYKAIPGVGVPVDKPVVAAVSGWCIGGGMVMTTMADILIAADDAVFSYPEVKIGFSGGLISNLATRIPHKIAMELLLVGDNVSAQRAYEVGYVNALVPAAEVESTAMRWAEKIAATAPLPSRMLKRFVGQTLPQGPTEAAAIARVQVEDINESADWVEGPGAFFERREPNFTGR